MSSSFLSKEVDSIRKAKADYEKMILEYVQCSMADAPRISDELNRSYNKLSQSVIEHGFSTTDKSEEMYTMDAVKMCCKANTEELTYLESLQQILDTRKVHSDRTKVGTLSVFGLRFEFNLKDQFPLLTTKRMFWKGIVEELLWMIRGCTDAKQLSAKGVTIWDANGTREFLDKRGLKANAVGDLGPIYGYQWRNWGGDQLQNLIKSIKEDPHSRRHILSAWNVTDIPKMALPPCHILCQFYVREGYLDCQLYQRSGDMGLGVPFNIASYSLLTYMIAHICGLSPGRFIHVIGDAHIYSTHVEAIQTQVARVPRPFPTLVFRRSVSNIDNFTADDFLLRGYCPHNTIQMSMSV